MCVFKRLYAKVRTSVRIIMITTKAKESKEGFMREEGGGKGRQRG